MKIDSLKNLKADLWVFDCDGVLYDNAKDAEKSVIDLMHKFITSRFKCSSEEAPKIRQKLLKKHQVPHSIMALIREGFDENEILLETYFKINFQKLGIVESIQTQRLFSSLSGEKVVLTNNHSQYAKEVLKHTGIIDYFCAVYGICELGLVQKPEQQAFQIVQSSMKIEGKIVFIDDEMLNVLAANKFGWTSVWKDDKGSGYNGLWLSKLK